MRSITSWRFDRVLRLLLGILAIIQAIVASDLLIGFLGALLFIMAFFNLGCCGAGGCTVKTKRGNEKKDIPDVRYDEVK